jgi:hypothetical protein
MQKKKKHNTTSEVFALFTNLVNNKSVCVAKGGEFADWVKL